MLGGFIDKYNVKLPGKQNAAVSPGGCCEVLHVEVCLHGVGWLCWCVRVPGANSFPGYHSSLLPGSILVHIPGVLGSASGDWRSTPVP